MSSLKKLVELARARGHEPFIHENHKLPVTRRELVAGGFTLGGGLLITPSLLSFASAAQAAECGDPNGDLAVFRNTPKIMVFEAPGGLSAANRPSLPHAPRALPIVRALAAAPPPSCSPPLACHRPCEAIPGYRPPDP